MIKSESIKELATALAKAQAEMKNAPKASDNPFYRSKYADLASVWDVARPTLTKFGLSVVQIPLNDVAGKLYLETILLHESGEYIGGALEMKPVRQEKDKGFVPADDPQAIGSAVSYARRYGLAAICGVATEDDDGNAASGKKAEKDSKPATSAPPPSDTSAADTVFKEIIHADEISMRDELEANCQIIAAAKNIAVSAVLASLTAYGKFVGYVKISDVPFIKTKADKTEWRYLETILSKSKKVMDELDG